MKNYTLLKKKFFDLTEFTGIRHRSVGCLHSYWSLCRHLLAV